MLSLPRGIGHGPEVQQADRRTLRKHRVFERQQVEWLMDSS